MSLGFFPLFGGEPVPFDSLGIVFRYALGETLLGSQPIPVHGFARTKDRSMARTFLLTWNPDKGAEPPPHGKIGNWTCHSKAPNEGDRVFLSRVGLEPGICASGRVVSFRSGDTIHEDEHWDPERRGKKARYVNVQWDSLSNPIGDPLLSRSELEEGVLGGMNWGPQSSGVEIRDKKITVELGRRWAKARRASQSSNRDSATSSRQPPPVGKRPAACGILRTGRRTKGAKTVNTRAEPEAQGPIPPAG